MIENNHMEDIQSAIELLQHFRKAMNDEQYARDYEMERGAEILEHLID